MAAGVMVAGTASGGLIKRTTYLPMLMMTRMMPVSNLSSSPTFSLSRSSSNDDFSVSNSGNISVDAEFNGSMSSSSGNTFMAAGVIVDGVSLGGGFSNSGNITVDASASFSSSSGSVFSDFAVGFFVDFAVGSFVDFALGSFVGCFVGLKQQYYICNNESKFKSNDIKINKILNSEQKMYLSKENTFKALYLRRISCKWASWSC